MKCNSNTYLVIFTLCAKSQDCLEEWKAVCFFYSFKRIIGAAALAQQPQTVNVLLSKKLFNIRIMVCYMSVHL